MGQLLFGGAQYKVQKAQVTANRLLQKANNEKAAAESELQRFSAQLNNRRRMDAAGKNIAALESNIARNIDAKATGDFNAQIGLAEELGRSATMASAAGVGGSTIEAYNSTVRLRSGMDRQQTDNAFQADLYNASQDKGAMLTDAVAGLDNNQYRANLDYRRWVDPHKQSLLSKVAEVGLTAAATYFGGPQAGSAVMGVFDSMNMAQNGDYAGAASTFNGAVKNGISAYKDTRAGGGNTFWSSTGSNTGGGGGSSWFSFDSDSPFGQYGSNLKI